jgi:hypothetical protein
MPGGKGFIPGTEMPAGSLPLGKLPEGFTKWWEGGKEGKEKEPGFFDNPLAWWWSKTKEQEEDPLGQEGRSLWQTIKDKELDLANLDHTKKRGIIDTAEESATENVAKQGLHSFWDLLLEGLEESGAAVAETPIPGGQRGGLFPFRAFESGGGTRGQRDKIPAWLAPTEYVWNQQAVDKYGWFIDWANWDALHGNTGKFTDGMARGFEGGGSPGLLQVIWDNPRTGSQVGEAGGQLVGPGTSQPGYYRDDWGDHTGHVHTSFASGPNGEFYGLKVGTDIRPGASGFPDWVYSLGAQYGLQASTYPGHQEKSGFNRGIDWWPAGVQDMSGQSYTPEMLQRLQAFAESLAMAGSGGAGATGPQAAGGGVGGSSVSFTAADYAPGGPGTAPGGGGGMPSWPGASGGPGSTPFYGGAAGPGGSYGPGGLPGLPGQYGGFGAFGGETSDQQYQLSRQTQSARDRIGTLQHDVDTKQAERNRVQAEYDKLNSQLGLARDDAQIQAKKDELANLDYELNDLKTRQIPEATGELGHAQQKEAEGAYKKPEGYKGKSAQGDAASEFGREFLGGIAQSLGFPDIFGGKPPWEWGAFKMLTRFISPFLSPTGEEKGKGATNGMSFPGAGLGGMMPNMMGGMTSAMGLPGMSPFGRGMPGLPGMGTMPPGPGGFPAIIPPGGIPGMGTTPGPQHLPGPVPGQPAPLHPVTSQQPGAQPLVHPVGLGGGSPMAAPGYNLPGVRPADFGSNYGARYAPSPNPGADPLDGLVDQLFNVADSVVGSVSSSFQGGKGGKGGPVGPDKAESEKGTGPWNPQVQDAGYATGGDTYQHNGDIHNHIDNSITVAPATDQKIASSMQEAQNQRTTATMVANSPSFQGIRP